MIFKKTKVNYLLAEAGSFRGQGFEDLSVEVKIIFLNLFYSLTP